MALRPLFCLFLSGRLRQVSLYLQRINSVCTVFKCPTFGTLDSKRSTLLIMFYNFQFQWRAVSLLYQMTAPFIQTLHVVRNIWSFSIITIFIF